MIIHRKIIFHVEAHKGYRPRFSIRLEPKPGTKVFGDWPGTLKRCGECDGDGLLLHEQ